MPRPGGRVLAATLLITTLTAHGQAVDTVPASVSAVTVHLCDQPRGCDEAFEATAAQLAEQGLPLLRLDAVLAAGPEGGDSWARWERSWAASQTERLDLRDPDLDEIDEAWTALSELPLTMPDEVPFTLLLLRADRRLSQGDAVGGRADLDAALSSSGGRIHDLPPLRVETRDALLARAEERRSAGTSGLEVHADVPVATVFIDGAPAGSAPTRVEVEPGWHRITVERPGRATAWVGAVDLPRGGEQVVRSTLRDEDASDALVATLVAATHGQDTDPAAVQGLVRWARSRGLRWVRVLRVVSTDLDDLPVPDERIEGADGSRWSGHAAWLDVPRGRLVHHGPGPAALQVAADPERFRLGLGVGPEGLGGRMHAAIEVVALWRLRPWLSADVRLGLMHSGTPYYLYEDWTDRNLYPLRLGARASRSGGGPYGGAQLDIIVPYALGAHAFGGWELAPSSRWRVGVEARIGATDEGLLWGLQLSLARRG